MYQKQKPRKTEIIRKQIRAKQIEEYKKKIRQKMELPQYSNDGEGCSSPNFKQSISKLLDMGKCSLGQNSGDCGNWLEFESSKQQIQRIKRVIEQLDFAIENLKKKEKDSREVEYQLDGKIQEYRTQIDKILGFIFEEQQAIKSFHSVKFKRIFALLDFIAVESLYAFRFWSFQQRCILSDTFRFLLKKSIESRLPFKQSLRLIQLSIKYIKNILRNSSTINNTEKKCRKSTKKIEFFLYFNEIQEQIVQLIFQLFLVLQQEHLIQSDQNLQWEMNTLTEIVQIYNDYLTQYISQLQSNAIKSQLQLNQNQDGCYQDIGSLEKFVIKHLIQVYTNRLQQYWQAVSTSGEHIEEGNFIFLINCAANLIHRLILIFSHSHMKEVRELEKETSQNIFGSVMGVLVQLIQFIVQVVETLEQLHHDHGSSIQSSISFFKSINNKILIGSIHQMLVLQLYSEAELSTLIAESTFSAYILMCISTQLEQPQDRLHECQGNQVYSEYRENKLKQNDKINMEIECLKIALHLRTIGIEIDQEGILPLRYISRIADGRVNKFYFDKF